MASQVESIKWVPGAPFLVDGFRFQSAACRAYFLTHAHSDHTTGLSSTFNAGGWPQARGPSLPPCAAAALRPLSMQCGIASLLPRADPPAPPPSPLGPSPGPIYCTPTTARILRHDFPGLRRDLVRELPLDRATTICGVRAGWVWVLPAGDRAGEPATELRQAGEGAVQPQLWCSHGCSQRALSAALCRWR